MSNEHEAHLEFRDCGSGAARASDRRCSAMRRRALLLLVAMGQELNTRFYHERAWGAPGVAGLRRRRREGVRKALLRHEAAGALGGQQCSQLLPSSCSLRTHDGHSAHRRTALFRSCMVARFYLR